MVLLYCREGVISLHMNYMYYYTIISIEWLLKILTGNNETVIMQNVARNSSSFPVLP